jgi:hypothetical protein
VIWILQDIKWFSKNKGILKLNNSGENKIKEMQSFIAAELVRDFDTLISPGHPQEVDIANR